MGTAKMTFTANQAAYCRFTGATFTVVHSNGSVATLSDDSTRPVGELTSASPFRRDDESAGEYAERVERNEATAGRYFADATKPQSARYNEIMQVAAAYKGAPKWDRFRLAAQREFSRRTVAAAILANLTFSELMTDGEVSEALSYRWDELAVADVMASEAGALLQAAE